MPIFLVGFSSKVSGATADLIASLIEQGATRLWDGLWFVELDTPPHQLRGFLTSEAAFSVPADSLDIFYTLGRAASSDARSYFSSQISPRLIAPDALGETIATVRYCKDGEKIFAPAIATYRKRIAALDSVTALCNYMLRYGSDKSLGWHTYTPLYVTLFDAFTRSPKAILEIGLGTNYVDIPSNMGSHGSPGASLRGWRDYFPQAQIFGADIDTRVLFQEERIKTFFVDQLKPDTFQCLFKNMPETFFDIVIDDGLHTLEAARNTFNQTYGQVRSGGLYIIEDVSRGNLDDYLSMVEARECDGFSIDIRHPTNSYDNCLVVAQGR